MIVGYQGEMGCYALKSFVSITKMDRKKLNGSTSPL